MIYEIKKAYEAFMHPGIETSITKLIRNGLSYYLKSDNNASEPLTLYFSVNNVCNLRCKMCDVGMADEDGTFYKNLVIDKTSYELDIEVFKSIIDEVKEFKPFIALNSTEPLIYSGLIEAIEYCTKHSLMTSVTTGGYILPKKAEALAEAGLSRLIVSIDGPSEIHNQIRGKEDSFQRDIEGINKFYNRSKQLGHNSEIYVSYVISNLNYKYLVKTASLLKDVPITNLNFTYLWFIDDNSAKEQNEQFGDKYPVTVSCYNEHIDPREVNIQVLYEQIQEVSKINNVNILPNFSKEKLQHYFHNTDEFMVKSSKCMASWFFVQILADGRVMPYSRCHNESFGNVNDEKFMDIWNGKKMKEWRAFIRQTKKMPMCKRCDLVY